MLHHALAQPAVASLKRKSVEDFGLQGMVVLVAGFVTLFNFPINAAKWFISNEAGRSVVSIPLPKGRGPLKNLSFE